MKPEAQTLREKVKDLSSKVEVAQRELERMERACQHEYSETVYDPIVKKGYAVPAFKAGSDYWPEVQVPEETIDRWKRECALCGKIEYTQETSEEVRRKPKW